MERKQRDEQKGTEIIEALLRGQQARYIQYARPGLFTFVCSRLAARHVASILFHRSSPLFSTCFVLDAGLLCSRLKNR